MNDSLFYNVVYIWILLAIIIFPLVLKITAPYGRHSKLTWGPVISNRMGWIIMESPALILFSALFLSGTGDRPLTTWILFILWMLHYVNRTLIFPFRLRTRGKKMPVAIVIMAFCFNLVNAFINGYFLGSVAGVSDYPDTRLSSTLFLTGLVFFITGMFFNWQSDHILIHLRKPGEKGYIIPEKGLFRWVSCPNHLGEIIEWTGFFFIAWSTPALSFLVWSVINLVPRALQHHRWYKSTFHDYPKERKALIPFVL